MPSIIHDARFAVRMLRRTPLLTFVIVASLAASIGATSAIFSVVNGLLLRPLPYRDADRLVILWQRSPGLNVAQDWFSPGQYLDVRSEASSFDETAIAIGSSYNLTGLGDPERVDAAKVSSSFFHLVGASPLLGRIFSSEDDAPGAGPPAIVLSNGFWQRRFGGDASVLGRTVTLNGTVYSVVGVMPPDFVLNKEVLVAVYGIRNADMLLPLPLAESDRAERGHEDYNIYARLKDGVRLSEAQSELDGIALRMKEQYPENYPPNGGLTISAVPLLEQVVGDVRLALSILFGAVAVVLLIACANVANLLLARSAARQKELAVRVAIGAQRGRIVRQLLTESLILSLAGGLGGVALAYCGVATLRAFGPGVIPRLADVSVDARVLTFALAISVGTGLVFGIVPALRTSRFDLNDVLKDGSRSGGSVSGHQRLRATLVAVELALSLLLLAGAGLLVRSYARATDASPGFDPHNVLSMRLSLPGSKYSSPELTTAFYQRLDDRVRTLPGVTAAGTNFLLPLSTSSVGWGPMNVDGYVPADPHELVISNERFISWDYLRTMHIDVVEGRGFTPSDVKGAAEVSLVNEAFARRFWPTEDAIGKRVQRGDTDVWRTVVGVVRDVKAYNPDAEPAVAVYHPIDQISPNSRYLVVRTAGEPRDVLPAVIDEIHALDPDLPVYDVATMDERLATSLARRRFSMSLLAGLAAVALAVAALGVYGVLGYAVSLRTREFGVRMALGAGGGDIARLVLRQAATMVAIGVLAGLAAAFGLTRLMSSLLFGVTATDAATFVAVPAILVAVALLASYLPAPRVPRRSLGRAPPRLRSGKPRRARRLRARATRSLALPVLTHSRCRRSVSTGSASDRVARARKRRARRGFRGGERSSSPDRRASIGATAC